MKIKTKNLLKRILFLGTAISVPLPFAFTISCGNKYLEIITPQNTKSLRDVLVKDNRYIISDFQQGKNSIWNVKKIEKDLWATDLFEIQNQTKAIREYENREEFIQNLVNFMRYNIYHDGTIVELERIVLTDSVQHEIEKGTMGEYVKSEKTLYIMYDRLTNDGEIEPDISKLAYIIGHEYGHHTTISHTAASAMEKARSIFFYNKNSQLQTNVLKDKKWTDPESDEEWELPKLLLKSMEKTYRRLMARVSVDSVGGKFGHETDAEGNPIINQALRTILDTRLYTELNSAQEFSDRLPKNYWPTEDGLGNFISKFLPDSSSSISTGNVYDVGETFSRYHFSFAEQMTRNLQAYTLNVGNPNGADSGTSINGLGFDNIMYMLYDLEPYNTETLGNNKDFGDIKFEKDIRASDDGSPIFDDKFYNSDNDEENWKRSYKAMSGYGQELSEIYYKDNKLHLSGWQDLSKEEEFDAVLLEGKNGLNKFVAPVSYEMSNTYFLDKYNSDKRQKWDMEQWVSAPINIFKYSETGDRSYLSNSNLLSNSGFVYDSELPGSNPLSEKSKLPNVAFGWQDTNSKSYDKNNSTKIPSINGDQQDDGAVELKKEYDTNRFADYSIYKWTDLNDNGLIEDNEKKAIQGNEQKIDTYRNKEKISLGQKSVGIQDNYFLYLSLNPKNWYSNQDTAVLHLFDSMYSRTDRSYNDYLANSETGVSNYSPGQYKEETVQELVDSGEYRPDINLIPYTISDFAVKGSIPPPLLIPNTWYELWPQYSAYLDEYDKSMKNGAQIPSANAFFEYKKPWIEEEVYNAFMAWMGMSYQDEDGNWDSGFNPTNYDTIEDFIRDFYGDLR